MDEVAKPNAGNGAERSDNSKMVKQTIEYLRILLTFMCSHIKVIIGEVMSLYVLRALWNEVILYGELGF